MVGRGKGWEVVEMCESGQKVQTSRYKMNNGDVIDIMITAVNNMLYVWKLPTVESQFLLPQKERGSNNWGNEFVIKLIVVIISQYILYQHT